MKAMRWTVLRGRANDRGAVPKVLYKFGDKSAKLVYADGSHVRFTCVRCAVTSERLIVDDPKIVEVG
jgi:hypothetical protein